MNSSIRSARAKIRDMANIFDIAGKLPGWEKAILDRFYQCFILQCVEWESMNNGFEQSRDVFVLWVSWFPTYRKETAFKQERLVLSKAFKNKVKMCFVV